MEQEKREQERQLNASSSAEHEILQNTVQIQNRTEFDPLKRDIPNTSSHNMTTQGLVPIKNTQGINIIQQQTGTTNKPQFAPRVQQQWRNVNNMQLLPPSNQPPQEIISTSSNTGGG